MRAPVNEEDKAVVLPFKPHSVPFCCSEIVKRFPNVNDARVYALGTIWDEVVHHIINEMMSLSLEDWDSPHIDIREDMALELAKLLLWLSERVVERRTSGQGISDIDSTKEREECLGLEGKKVINNTAQRVYQHIWKRKMEERWKPKSAKAIEREKSPRTATLSIKPVNRNHFIPRWFIRDLWTDEGEVLRWRRTEAGWTSVRRGFGKWGYRHNLYSDRLEAYFALIEGDAKQPIEMLLDTRPLNGPQRESFVGFLIIQMLRNPFLIEAVQQGIAPVIALEGYSGDPTMAARAFEALFSNNEFYDQIARPVMWSRWAIVRSTIPLFVLPDRFGVCGDMGDGLRMIVPLTPNACFVTLSDRENEKRVVPHYLPTNESLARRISAALIQAAGNEFVSHQGFVPDETPATTFSGLIEEISKTIALRENCAF